MPFLELLQRYSSSEISRCLLDEICVNEKLPVLDLFFNCASALSFTKSLDLAKFILDLIVFIISNRLIKSFDSPEVVQLFADTLFTIPVKISNLFESDPNLKDLLFIQLVNHDLFPAAMIKRSLKRLFVLGEYQFLLCIASHDSDTRNEFVTSLSCVEIVHFGKRCIELNISLKEFLDSFKHALNIEILVSLLEIPIETKFYSFFVSFSGGKQEIFKLLVDKYWRTKSFVAHLPAQIHNQICMFIKLTWMPDDSTHASLMKGIDYHLDSKNQEYKIIGMTFAEKITNGEASFNLDSCNPLVSKWSFEMDNMSFLNEENDKIIDVVSTPREKFEFDLKKMENGLKALKIKPLVFIGEIIELLRIKEKDRSTQEAILQYGPSIILNCQRTEISDHFQSLIRLLVHLRDDFESEEFSTRKNLLISTLIRKDPVKSVHFICNQIFSNAISEGDKLFLLDIFNSLFISVEKSMNSNQKDNTKQLTSSAISSSNKVRYIAATALKLRKSCTSQPVDHFLGVFIPNVFFSILYQLPQPNNPITKPSFVLGNLFESLVLFLSNCLIQAINLPVAPKMNDEFGVFVVQHLTISTKLPANSTGTIDEAIKTTLCCYYAFASTVNYNGNSLGLYLKIAQELDFLLENFSLDNEIRSLAISVMQNISELIKEK